jgi:hypothetical protein
VIRSPGRGSTAPWPPWSWAPWSSWPRLLGLRPAGASTTGPAGPGPAGTCGPAARSDGGGDGAPRSGVAPDPGGQPPVLVRRLRRGGEPPQDLPLRRQEGAGAGLLFGRAWKAAGHISIDRTNQASAVASLDRAGGRCAGEQRRGHLPEGTRSPTDDLLPFKKGAFMLALHTGVPIVPFAVAGSRRIFPRVPGECGPGPLSYASAAHPHRGPGARRPGRPHGAGPRGEVRLMRDEARRTLGPGTLENVIEPPTTRTVNGMPSISEIRARQILDSRGNPTVEADVRLESGAFGRPPCPAARPPASWRRWSCATAATATWARACSGRWQRRGPHRRPGPGDGRHGPGRPSTGP